MRRDVILTWPIVAAVLFGALLHASWNALIKSGRDSQLDTALIHLLGCGVGAVLVAVVGLPPAAALPWLAASVVIHVGYYVTLVGAYRHGELGFAYPIMRGTAPLLVALASGQLIGEHLPVATWIGVAGISAGVLAIGLTRSATARRLAPPRPRLRARQRRDHRHVHHRRRARRARVGHALRYVALLFLVDGLPYFAIVLWQRRASLAPIGRLHARALAGRLARRVRVARRLRHRAVGDDARAGRIGRRVARDVGAVRGADRRRRAEGALPLQRALGTGAVVIGVMALRLA